MRKILLATAALVALSGPAFAQLNLAIDTREPITKLDAEQWAGMIRKFINAAPIIGHPDIYLVNATPEPIAAVTCGKWQLVGNKPYDPENPKSLPPWSVTFVGAKGFDGYCGKGQNALVGSSGSGDIYNGSLNAADGSFTNSTFVTFSPKNKQ